MKSLLFTLAIIALATAAVDQRRVALISKHIYTLAQTGYEVDTVLQLLNALENVQTANLNTLVDNWAVTEQGLEDNIAALEDLSAQQHAWCDQIDATVEALKEERRRYAHYIDEAQDLLQTNADTLAARLDARCTANLGYVNKLKANQDAAALLTFLRGQVANPGFKDYLSASAGALVELKTHITEKKHHALSMIAKHHMMAMIQQAYAGEDDLGYNTQARTDEEIGTGHVDNDRGALAVDNFTIDARDLDDFIAELLGFIDGLIAAIEEDNDALAAAEFQAVEDLIAYQDQIEAEAVVLNLYISQWSAHIDDLSATIDQDEEASAECHARADEIDASVEAAEEDLADKTAAFEAKRDSLQHTIDALGEVIEVYAEKVASAAEEYKRRYDQEISERKHENEPVEEESTFVLESEANGGLESALEGANEAGWANSAEEEFFVQRRFRVAKH